MREGPKVEFKESITNTFLKTVSAYSNYDGGQIIFGVDDDGTVIGVSDTEKVCLSIENKINDSIAPMPEYSLKVNSNKTVILKVEPGVHKPYLYKAKAYKRHDTATVEVDSLEMNRLILEGSHMTYDATKSVKQDLTFNTLERYLKQSITISEFDMDTMKTLNLYSEQDGYNNAASILADTNDFPGIDIARFGETISIILKRENIRNVSALVAYEKAVDLYRDYYTYEVIDGIVRRTVEKIPESAFREAVANALVHRLWDVNAQIRISMLENRIEIVSPGGLPSGMSKTDYLKGNLSILRNPILANVFFRLNLVEIFGTGILRINESYKSSVKQPEFDMTENMIKVVLPILEESLELSADEKIVYDILSKTVPKSVGEIIPRTNFGRSKVKDILNKLIEKNIVISEGAGRGTKYRVR